VNPAGPRPPGFHGPLAFELGQAGSAATGRTSYHPVMKTSGITAALPAQDLGRAKAFYVEKVGFRHSSPTFSRHEMGR
jgi:hypothetical protein